MSGVYMWEAFGLLSLKSVLSALNQGPEGAPLSLSPVFVVLGYRHTHLFTDGLWLLSNWTAELGCFDREHMAHKAENIIISGPLRKKLVNPADRGQVISR